MDDILTYFVQLFSFFYRSFTSKMGKKNRENNSVIQSTTATRQQDEIFEYLTKTFNQKDGPIQVDISILILFIFNHFLG